MIPTNPTQFLKEHFGNKYSWAWFGEHKIKWSQTELSKNTIDPRINLCQLNHDELIFEADYNKELNNLLLEWLKINLMAMKVWYMETTHKGKSNYVWVKLTTEDNREITEAERKAVLEYFGFGVRRFDLALAYLNFVRPVPNMPHWKHNNTEEVVEIHEGAMLNIDKLDLVVKANMSKGGSKGLSTLTKVKDTRRIGQNSDQKGWARRIDIDRVFDRHNLGCPCCSAERSYVITHQDKGLFWCVKCREGGNILGLMRLIGGISQ